MLVVAAAQRGALLRLGDQHGLHHPRFGVGIVVAQRLHRLRGSFPIAAALVLGEQAGQPGGERLEDLLAGQQRPVVVVAGQQFAPVERGQLRQVGPDGRLRTLEARQRRTQLGDIALDVGRGVDPDGVACGCKQRRRARFVQRAVDAPEFLGEAAAGARFGQVGPGASAASRPRGCGAGCRSRQARSSRLFSVGSGGSRTPSTAIVYSPRRRNSMVGWCAAGRPDASLAIVGRLYNR
jgi:hypothetical protein